MKRKTHSGYARTKVTQIGSYFLVQVEQDYVVYSDEYDENWVCSAVTLETERQEQLAYCAACDKRLATKLCTDCRGVLLCRNCSIFYELEYYCPFCYEQKMRTLADEMRERKDEITDKQRKKAQAEVTRLSKERLEIELPKLVDRFRHHQRSQKRRIAEGRPFKTPTNEYGLAVLPENTPPGVSELPIGAEFLLKDKIVDALIEGTIHNVFAWSMTGDNTYRTTFEKLPIEFQYPSSPQYDPYIKIGKGENEVKIGMLDSTSYLYAAIQKQISASQL